MAKFVNRSIEEHDDGMNITYFLYGDKPLPRMLIDDIEGVIYQRFGENAFGEKMYFKISSYD